jgi:predicted small metal-binding protein
VPKSLRCRDLGIHCDFEASGNTAEEVLAKAAAHARTVRKITEVTPDLVAKARNAIGGNLATGSVRRKIVDSADVIAHSLIIRLQCDPADDRLSWVTVVPLSPSPNEELN